MPTTIQYNETPSWALLTTNPPQVMEELEGSPNESLRNDGAMITRSFRVPNDYRLSPWAQGMLVRSSSSGGSCTVIKPMNYTHAPLGAASRWRVAQVDFAPFGDRVQTGTAVTLETFAYYTWVRATVTYRLLDSITEELQVGSEYTTLGSTGLHWDNGDALTEREAPGLLIHQAIWSVTRRWLPIVPPEYLNLVGQVNPQTIASVRYGTSFGAGTLLYQAPVIRSYSDHWGGPLHDVTARMLYRPHGWNQFWMARANRWGLLMCSDPHNPSQYTQSVLYPLATNDGSFPVLCQYQGSDL